MATADSAGGEAKQFDWQTARARLDRVLEKLESAANPSPTRVQEVLQARALRYAGQRGAEAPQAFLEVIGFSLGEDRFAVALDQGAAVAPLSNLTSLPGIPAFYLGLISHRGGIFPVVDPRPLLGIKRGKVAAPRYAVLIRSEHGAVGLAAEEIQGITRFRTAEVAAVNEETSRLRAVSGVGPQETMILDSARLLQDARLLVDDQPMLAAN